jgi:uncharacterized FlaG/YvyC family protein
VTVVTPDMALSIDQALPLLSNAKFGPSPQEDKAGSTSGGGVVLSKDSKLIPVDTVNISSQSRQTITDAAKEKSLAEEAIKNEINTVNKKEKSDRTAAKVEFAYDLNGDLITRYLDSTSRLVYQTPSELMLRLKETILKSDFSVDTKA